MTDNTTIKKGYKQTEVGVIPKDWEVTQLGRIGSFKKGKGIKKDTVISDGFPCVRYGELYTTHHEYIKQFNSYISIETAKESQRINKGDLLFAGSGETKEEIGKCAAFIGGEEAYAGGDVIILSPKEMDSLYLGFLLNHELVVKQKAQRAQGDAVVHIYPNNLSDISIPLPPTKAEQTAIAATLSDADALIQSIEKLIAKKGNIKQGAMQELLNPKEGWVVKRLGDYIKFQVGFPFSSEFFNQKGDGLRLVKNRDLKSDDQIFYFNSDYAKFYLVKNGDILIGMDGDFLPCRWTKGTALLNQRVGRLVSLKDIDFNFLYYYLEKPLIEIENRTSSTTVKHLSHKDIENIEIPLPLPEEQTRIATILSDMDAEITALETKLAKYKQVKQGMMQELLTGKTRLI